MSTINGSWVVGAIAGILVMAVATALGGDATWFYLALFVALAIPFVDGVRSDW